jgi:hypothetical protein
VGLQNEGHKISPPGWRCQCFGNAAICGAGFLVFGRGLFVAFRRPAVKTHAPADAQDTAEREVGAVGGLEGVGGGSTSVARGCLFPRKQVGPAIWKRGVFVCVYQFCDSGMRDRKNDYCLLGCTVEQEKLSLNTDRVVGEQKTEENHTKAKRVDSTARYWLFLVSEMNWYTEEKSLLA